MDTTYSKYLECCAGQGVTGGSEGGRISSNTLPIIHLEHRRWRFANPGALRLLIPPSLKRGHADSVKEDRHRPPHGLHLARHRLLRPSLPLDPLPNPTIRLPRPPLARPVPDSRHVFLAVGEYLPGADAE